MPQVYIDPAGPAPGFYAELTTFSTGGNPPERPTPAPNPPGIWGPNDPRPSHPITGIPGLPPPLGPSAPGQPPVTAPPGANATVIPLPASATPTPPPTTGLTQMLIYFGNGSSPAYCWVGPFAQQLPTPGTGPNPAPMPQGR